MANLKCPTTAIEYVTLVDYYDKFQMINGMSKYIPYIKLLTTKRIMQMQRRFYRRLNG